MTRTKTEWMKILALNIRRISKMAGLTALDLSKRSGIHVTTISQLKNDTAQNPSLDTLVALADALGVSLKDLFIEDGAKEPSKLSFVETPKHLTFSEWFWEKFYAAVPGGDRLGEKEARKRFDAFLYAVRPDLELTTQQKDAIWQERVLFHKNGG